MSLLLLFNSPPPTNNLTILLGNLQFEALLGVSPLNAGVNFEANRFVFSVVNPNVRFEARTGVGAAPSIKVEVLAGARALAPIADEALRGVRIGSSTPLEALGGVGGIANAPFEEQGTAFTAFSLAILESLRSVSAFAPDKMEVNRSLNRQSNIANEKLRAQLVTASAIVEAIRGVGIAAAAVDLETRGGVGAAQSVAQVEALSGARSAIPPTPLETALGVRGAALARMEALTGVISKLPDVNTETAGTAFQAFTTIILELLGGVGAKPALAVEIAAGVFGRWNSPEFETTAGVNNAIAARLEALTGVRGLSSANFETNAATFTALSLVVIEAIRNARATSAGPAFESLRSVAGLVPAPAEDIALMRILTRPGVEALTGVRVLTSGQFEAQGTAFTSLSRIIIEALSGIASVVNTPDFETTLSLRALAREAFEALGGVNARPGAPFMLMGGVGPTSRGLFEVGANTSSAVFSQGILIEVVRSLAAASRLGVEDIAGVAGLGNTPDFETLAGIRSAQFSPEFETISTFRAISPPTLIESALSVRGAPAAPLMALGGVSGLGNTPDFETLSGMSIIQGAKLETLRGAFAALSSARLETLLGTTGYLPPFIFELLGGAAARAAVPFETGANIRLSTSAARIETLARLSRAAAALVEASGGVVGASRLAPVELLAGVKALSLAPNEHLAIAAIHVVRAAIAFEVLNGSFRALSSFNLENISNTLFADPRFTSQLRARAFMSSLAARRFVSLLGLPVPKGPDCSVMDVGETVTGAIDFDRWLPAGVSITSIVSITVANYQPIPGRQGSTLPYLSLSGSAQIGTAPVAQGGSGVFRHAILQKWTGLEPGIARVTAKITTSDGQTLSGWVHQPVQVPN